MRAAHPRRQAGAVALLFALLIVALVSSVAAAIAYDVALDVRRTSSLLFQEQARLVAFGAEDWIGDILRQDKNDTQDDHAGELWAQELPPLPIEGAGMQGVITGRITDMQSRYNLNNLLDGNGQPVATEVDYLKRLFVALDIPPEQTDKLIDWMDADVDFTFPGGAEDDIYTARIPPLRTANLPLRSIGELALIEGFTPEMLARLRPHISALPERTPINANTATLAVLTALDDNLTLADAERIGEERAESGLSDLDVSFAGLLPQPTIDALATETGYFELRSVVRIDTVRFTMYSLLYRNPQGNIAVVMRSFGSPL